MKVRISRWVNGTTVVAITLTDGDYTMRYAQRCYTNDIPATIKLAKTYAHRALAEAKASTE